MPAPDISPVEPFRHGAPCPAPGCRWTILAVWNDGRDARCLGYDGHELHRGPDGDVVITEERLSEKQAARLERLARVRAEPQRVVVYVCPECGRRHACPDHERPRPAPPVWERG